MDWRKIANWFLILWLLFIIPCALARPIDAAAVAMSKPNEVSPQDIQKSYSSIIKSLRENWVSPIAYLKERGYIPNDPSFEEDASAIAQKPKENSVCRLNTENSGKLGEKSDTGKRHTSTSSLLRTSSEESSKTVLKEEAMPVKKSKEDKKEKKEQKSKAKVETTTAASKFVEKLKAVEKVIKKNEQVINTIINKNNLQGDPKALPNVLAPMDNKKETPDLNLAKFDLSPVLPLNLKPTTTLLEDKATSTLLDDKPATSLLDDKPATSLLDDKPATSLLDDKPATSLLEDKSATTLLEDKLPLEQNKETEPLKFDFNSFGSCSAPALNVENNAAANNYQQILSKANEIGMCDGRPIEDNPMLIHYKYADNKFKLKSNPLDLDGFCGPFGDSTSSRSIATDESSDILNTARIMESPFLFDYSKYDQNLPPPLAPTFLPAETETPLPYLGPSHPLLQLTPKPGTLKLWVPEEQKPPVEKTEDVPATMAPQSFDEPEFKEDTSFLREVKRKFLEFFGKKSDKTKKAPYAYDSLLSGLEVPTKNVKYWPKDTEYGYGKPYKYNFAKNPRTEMGLDASDDPMYFQDAADDQADDY